MHIRRFLTAILLGLCMAPCMITAGSFRNTSILEYESRDNGVAFLSLEDTASFAVAGIPVIIGAGARIYSDSILLDVETGLVAVWPAGTYSGFSYNLGLTLEEGNVAADSLNHILYMDLTRETAADMLITGLKGYYNAASFSVVPSCLYTLFLGDIDVRFRGSLSWNSVAAWGGSIGTEAEWRAVPQWSLNGGVSLGTFKREDSPELLGADVALTSGIGYRFATHSVRYLFGYSYNPDWQTLRHSLILALKY